MHGILISSLSTECADTHILMRSAETKLSKVLLPSYAKHLDDILCPVFTFDICERNTLTVLNASIGKRCQV